MSSGSGRDRRPRRGESSSGRRSDGARRSGGQGSGKRPGGQRSARSRAQASTGGAFKLSSTRRAAVLALLVCAMALSVAVPLRTYMSQLDELAAQRQHRAAMAQQVDELEHRHSQLSDPTYIEAEARARLGMVRPGETPYIVEVPDAPTGAPPPPLAADTSSTPWYEQLWNSLTAKGT